MKQEEVVETKFFVEIKDKLIKDRITRQVYSGYELIAEVYDGYNNLNYKNFWHDLEQEFRGTDFNLLLSIDYRFSLSKKCLPILELEDDFIKDLDLMNNDILHVYTDVSKKVTIMVQDSYT